MAKVQGMAKVLSHKPGRMWPLFIWKGAELRLAGPINTDPQKRPDYLPCNVHCRRHLQSLSHSRSLAATALPTYLPGHSMAEQGDSASLPLQEWPGDQGGRDAADELLPRLGH